MKKLQITQRMHENWTTNSGDEIIQGRFYVVIDRKPNKIKLAGFENHWALENRFSIANKQVQEKLTALINSFDDLQNFSPSDTNTSASKIQRVWGLSDESMASLYECINYIKDTKEQALIVWATS
tara:strand:+ start:13673 stop:14047 length:375 start_codon:yes stop_codon:yes gene_type:complete